MFSGCAGDLIAASIVAMGNVRVLGTPTTVTYAGTVTTDSKLTLAYEYESESETVPETTTIAGVGLAFGLGCWWKRKVGKRTFK